MAVGSNDVRAGGAYVEIGTDEKGFNRGISNVKQRLGRFVTNIGSMGKKLMIAGGILGAPMILAIKKASDFEETITKFRAVFKTWTQSGRDWAQTTAKDYGRGEGAVLKFMATIQDTFVPLGASRAAAAALSDQVARLAINLASFNNMADEEVLNLLQSALVGVHRSVRRFGVVITQATLDQQLMNDGVKEGTKAATELQKAEARLKLIVAATSDAANDASKTAGGFANMMKRLRARVNDLAETIGFKLIPITKPYVKLATDIANRIKEWADKNGVVVQTIGRLVAVMTILGGAMVVVSNGLRMVWSTIKTVLILAPILALADALGLIPQALKDIIAEVKVGKQTLAEWVEPMQKALLKFWKTIKKTGLGLFELVNLVVNFIVSKAIDVGIRLLEILGKVIKAAWKGLLSGSKNAFASIISELKGERPDDPAMDSKAKWSKWLSDRLSELKILKKGFQDTFTSDKEVFEDVNRKLKAILRQYEEVAELPKMFKTVPGTFSSFRLSGVAAGGVDRMLNMIAKNTSETAKNTRDMTARAGE